MSLDISLYETVDTGIGVPETVEVFDANITHNLSGMAYVAGLYDVMWRPDELEHVKVASDIVDALRNGLQQLLEEPDKFRPMNPPNGWGCYDGLVEVVTDYLKACILHPNATIVVSR